MNNAELIKALRNCSSAEGTCAECEYKSRVYPGTCNGCKWDMMRDAADALEAAEKRIAGLEAQMPKEGEWRFSRGDGKTCVDGWTCSACGNSFHTNVPYFEEFHYCPNCGARMKGEQE